MFTETDLVFHKALMKVLDEAKFSLSAREVKSFLAVYDWVKELPNKKAQPKIVKKKEKKSGN